MATLLINPQNFTVKRTTAEGYNQTTFAFEPGTESTISIVGELQPLSGREREDLPEGYRERATYKLYTDALLRVISQETGEYSDKIELDGIDYEVFEHFDRSAGDWEVSHHRYTLLRVGEDEG